VRIRVSFGAGVPADIDAHQLRERLGPELREPFVVENRRGTGAVIGTEAAKSAADGQRLLMMSNTHTANATRLSNRPHVLLRDLVPVAPVNIADKALIA